MNGGCISLLHCFSRQTLEILVCYQFDYSAFSVNFGIRNSLAMFTFLIFCWFPQDIIIPSNYLRQQPCIQILPMGNLASGRNLCHASFGFFLTGLLTTRIVFHGMFKEMQQSQLLVVFLQYFLSDIQENHGRSDADGG